MTLSGFDVKLCVGCVAGERAVDVNKISFLYSFLEKRGEEGWERVVIKEEMSIYEGYSVKMSYILTITT